MPAHRRTHYTGTYTARARRLRIAATRDPYTICWRCGQPARPGDPWQAGHLRDSDPTSPLLPEHRSCNTSAGATIGNALRGGRKPSRRW